MAFRPIPLPSAALPKQSPPPPKPAAAAAAAKNVPIELNVAAESAIKIVNWPYRRVQRRDGVSRDADGERIYRSEQTFAREYVHEQLERERALNKDPLYDFLKILAGLCRADVDRDILQTTSTRGSGGGARGTAAAVAAAERSATRSAFPGSSPLDIANRALQAAKREELVPRDVLLKAINKERIQQLSQEDKKRLQLYHQAEELARLISLLTFVFDAEYSDQAVSESDASEAMLELVYSTRKARDDEERNITWKQFAINIGIWKPETSTFSPLIAPAYLEEGGNERLVELANNLRKAYEDRGNTAERQARIERWFSDHRNDGLLKIFENQTAIRRSYYKDTEARLARDLKHLETRLTEAGATIVDYFRESMVLRHRLHIAERQHAKMVLIATGEYPETFQDQSLRYRELVKLLEKESRTLSEILSWDLQFNKGEISQDIYLARQQRETTAAQTEEGGGDWVGRPENLGWVFMKDEYKSAIEQAAQDVSDVAGKQRVPSIHLMTHQRVRVDFARLASLHVQMGRINNPTRNESEKKATRLRRDLKLCKQKFKSLAYSIEDGFLYFAGIQDPFAAADRDIATADSLDYTEATGEYYSDLYRVDHLRAGLQPQPPVKRTRQTTVSRRLAELPGRMGFELLGDRSLHLTGGEERQLLEQQQSLANV